MSRGKTTRLLFGLVAVIAMAAALIAVFRAYQNPANIVQWLSLLQLCR